MLASNDGEQEGGEEEQDDDETVVETLTICSLIEAKTHVQEHRRYFESCAATIDYYFAYHNYLMRNIFGWKSQLSGLHRIESGVYFYYL